MASSSSSLSVAAAAVNLMKRATTFHYILHHHRFVVGERFHGTICARLDHPSQVNKKVAEPVNKNGRGLEEEEEETTEMWDVDKVATMSIKPGVEVNTVVCTRPYYI
jgi:hypothetical protein